MADSDNDDDKTNTSLLAAWTRLARAQPTAGIALLIAAAIALIWANSAFGDSYISLRDHQVGFEAEWLHMRLSIGDWAKDAVLALFFFVVGLELKRELVVGDLADVKAALLPILAAIGGMLAPALVCLALSWGEPGFEKTWAIPMATDIAFALGVLALAARNLPSGARVFLLSLAVADDLGAIIIIAVLFTTSFSIVYAIVAAAALASYTTLQTLRIRSSWLYVPLAVVIWIAVHEVGIHATIAGVLLGLLTRVKPDPDEHEAPAVRLEHRLQPYSGLVAVPLYALFAAGVPVDGEALNEVFTGGVPQGIMAGLFFGKLIGITGASYLTVRLGWGTLPPRIGWPDISALALLGGVGFTVSLLVAELSLPSDQYGEEVEAAKAAVLIASTVAAVAASAILAKRSKSTREAEPSEGSDETASG